MAILEWKARTLKFSERDISWLSDFSKERLDFVGYAVSFSSSQGGPSRLRAARIANGRAQRDWLDISVDSITDGVLDE